MSAALALGAVAVVMVLAVAKDVIIRQRDIRDGKVPPLVDWNRAAWHGLVAALVFILVGSCFN